jgi:hypothetical protein
VGCDDGHLRGHVSPSPDGKTYIVLEDDHDGCAVLLDGAPWSNPSKSTRPISPGEHTITCLGGDIRFTVPKGVVYHFDYWGP